MPNAEQTLRTYRELAEDYGRQGQAQLRDRFLVLAADAALAAGQKDEAERLRGRLLQHNPHHLLKPYSSFAEAMKAADVQNYIGALRRSHPYDKAETMLEDLRRSGPHKVAPSPAASEPRVLRVMDDPAPAAAPSRAAMPPQPAPARSASAPNIVPLRRETISAPAAAAVFTTPEEPRAGSGAWVSVGLFFLTLTAGVLLAAYTLLRPFLPGAWF